jgi:hypothetical protein
MRTLVICFLGVVATTLGIMFCEGAAKHAFQVGFAIVLAGSFLLILAGGLK